METLSRENIVENLYHKFGNTFCVYKLPILAVSPRCFVNENTSHVGRDRYAMDFDVSVGTIVYAPAGGKIVLIQQHNTIASHNGSDGDRVNQIIVRTSRHESYELKHIEANSCRYKIGDEIHEGDELARVGLNGYYIEDGGVEFPSHLHFAVHSKRSLPLRVRFRDLNVVYGLDGSVVFSKK